MSQFIETIKLLDGELKNIRFHQSRFEQTRSGALGLRTHPLLTNVIRIPNGLEKGLLKCRVIYGEKIERIEFEPHEPKPVRSLKLVHSDTISYGFKCADRQGLDDLFEQRGSSDDILIVKLGCITDSYYANVVFWDSASWFTPDTPLLKGTMRASLLATGSIKRLRITLNELKKFQKIRLINAMNNLKDGPEIGLDAVT